MIPYLDKPFSKSMSFKRLPKTKSIFIHFSWKLLLSLTETETRGHKMFTDPVH